LYISAIEFSQPSSAQRLLQIIAWAYATGCGSKPGDIYIVLAMQVTNGRHLPEYQQPTALAVFNGEVCDTPFCSLQSFASFLLIFIV